MMEIIWNPKAIPDNEDAVVLTVHQHSRHPTKTLGWFRATRQDSPNSAVFTTSDFNLPFREAFEKARAYAKAHGITCLYVVDSHGLGSMEVREW